MYQQLPTLVLLLTLIFPSATPQNFRLRHILHHQTSVHASRLSRLDFDPATNDLLKLEAETGTSFHYSIHKTLTMKKPLFKLHSPILRQDVGDQQSVFGERDPNMEVPDISDAEVVRVFGHMAASAYSRPSKSDWKDFEGWNAVTSSNIISTPTHNFGWETDGIRGYIYTSADNSTVILVFKGTTPQWPIGGGDTTPRDRVNDNNMFSCCCARVSWSRKAQTCECATAVGECRAGCLFQNINPTDSYFNLAQALFEVVKKWYPHANIWLVGHSLGGALASMVAVSNGMSAVSFSSPGELMFAHRVGLLPGVIGAMDATFPDYTEYLKTLPIWHIGNEHDPVFFG
ncbi:putative lipase atg15 [Nowakowskiella sp. JEL0078]|nr:putative lipase atg15 [Nowakowskiella sp. JEL0078]